MRKGFTLIEILIVVAIIAILASVVLIGLGPTQQSGRDARRLSDLHEVQNAIELYYQKCGFYPGTAAGGVCTLDNTVTYAGLSGAITGAQIGVSQALPVDPTNTGNYAYFYSTSGSAYILGATLENANNAVFNGYTWTTPAGITLPGTHTCLKANNEYCMSL